RGSAGVDLAVGRTVTITDSNVHLIESTVTGPLGFGLSAILIGRSSMSRIGVFVLPGLIDADYTGPIKIMVKVFSPPVTLTRGSKIAQLIPFKSQVPVARDIVRGNGAFGSTTDKNDPMVLFTAQITKERPKREVLLKNASEHLGLVTMMLDTGADVTIIP
ncbi:POK9 protein, partial [Notiomystis cincta]|nr:POK9 protein [Notiomystis cincta]